MTQGKSSSHILSRLTTVILSLLAFFILTLFTPVILSLSKEKVLFQDNLRGIPRHFDKLRMTIEKMKEV